MSDHPFFFTWTAQENARPMAIVGGKGAYFELADGTRMLDLGALVYQVNAGHGHSRIIEAVREQASRLCVASPAAVYPEKTALAEELLALAPPGFSKVFFTLGGSDANENALKIARLSTGRFKVVSRYRSYHGATFGALSLSGDYRRKALEPTLPGVVRVEDWECLRCPHGVRSPRCDHPPLSHIPRVLAEEGDVAAVFVESVVGANGGLIPPPGYMRRLREACDLHGTLLVCDEVLSGFGRTGRWLALEHFDGVVPDLITLGKALTSGYGTLGAVLVHERVASYFEKNPLLAGLTHYAHPLGVAAALAAIRVYRDERLIERAAALHVVLRQALDRMAGKIPRAIRQHRSIGLLAAIELVLDAAQYKKLEAGLSRRRVWAHVNPRAGCLLISPPLCIEEDDLQEGVLRVEAAIEEASR